MIEFLELLMEYTRYLRYVKNIKWLWVAYQEAGKMSEKEAITGDMEEEFRQVISEIKDAVHEGKSRLFHERTTLDDLFVTGRRTSRQAHEYPGQVQRSHRNGF